MVISNKWIQWTVFFFSLTFLVLGFLVSELGFLEIPWAFADDSAATTSQSNEAEGKSSTVEDLRLLLTKKVEGIQAKEEELSKRELTISEKEKLMNTEISRYEKIIQELTKNLEEERKRTSEFIQRLEKEKSEATRVAEEERKVELQKKEQFKRMYEKVDSKKAAKIMDSLNVKLATEILSEMNQAKAAEIIGAMQSDRAKKITENYLLSPKELVKEERKALLKPEDAQGDS